MGLKKKTSEQFVGWFRLFMLGAFVVLQWGCAPYYQENQYSAAPQRPEQQDYSSDSGIQDYQAYQSHFMSVSISEVAYSISEAMSFIIVNGRCFNPGFDRLEIFYKLYDASGDWLSVSDGYPYATNMVYYSGSENLQNSKIVCNGQGQWSAEIGVPSFVLNQVHRGRLDVKVMASYQGQQLTNEATGTASVRIYDPAQ